MRVKMDKFLSFNLLFHEKERKRVKLSTLKSIEFSLEIKKDLRAVSGRKAVLHLES